MCWIRLTHDRFQFQTLAMTLIDLEVASWLLRLEEFLYQIRHYYILVDFTSQT